MNMELVFEDNKEENQVEEQVEKENPLKDFLVNYVGEKTSPENDEVTVSMIVETVAKEFPEFLMLVAEENWVRGYQQALNDVAFGESLAMQEEAEK